jgi:site-specific DNA-methyltransferase (adenine-specific)
MPRRIDDGQNRLYYGDNLDVLRHKIDPETVDLCYIDPPFNSKRNFNQIYNNIGREDRAQAQAFIDTWTWDDRAIEGFDEILSNAQGRYRPQTVELIKGLHRVLDEGSMLAYLVSMTQRATAIHRVLKRTGSFYLHCDPTASHYLKLMLDSIFCSQGGNFMSEIVWRRTGAHNKAERWAPLHDVVFFYTKSGEHVWNTPRIPYMRKHVAEHFESDGQGGYRTNYYGNVLTGYGTRTGESGRPWRGIDPTAKGRHWAIPGRVWEEVGVDPDGLSQHAKLDLLYDLGVITIEDDAAWPIYQLSVDPSSGPAAPDIWSFQPYTNGTVFGTNDGIDEDVRWLSPRDAERLGYPTQKPEGLLDRIIQASSLEGAVILDACAGCGTTIAVAHRLKRQWIGIDITYQSISLILRRLEKAFGAQAVNDVLLDGIPRDMESAVALAHRKDDRLRKEFEKWAALTYTSNRAVINDKKGADGGIDARAYFKVGPVDNARIIFQVKSGGVDRGDVAKLRGDMGKEKAALGVLITLEEPTGPMRKDAKAAGQFHHEEMGRKYDVIQIVTVREIIEDGRRLEIPMSLEVLASARRHRDAEQPRLKGFGPSAVEQPERPDLAPQRRMRKAGLTRRSALARNKRAGSA